jgi:hypothetical protein
MGTDRPEKPHSRFERRLVVWLFVSYFLIFLMTVAIMLYASAPFLWPSYFKRRK